MSLLDSRRKLLAMWPIGLAMLPHLDMLTEVVRALSFPFARPNDK